MITIEIQKKVSLTIDFEIHLCEVENLWTGTYIQDNYIEEVYAVEDYTSTDEGGLSFSRGDRVYVLLRNRFGYCTGWLLFVADSLYSYHKT